MTLIFACRACSEAGRGVHELRCVQHDDGARLWECPSCGTQCGVQIDGGTLDLDRVGWDVSYRKGRLDRRRLFACGNVDYDETAIVAEYLVAIGRHGVRVTPTRPAPRRWLR